MVQRLLKWLKQPYPVYEDGNVWSGAVYGFLFVTFFLYIFRPFGMASDELSEGAWFRICVEFGLVTLLISIAWGFFVVRSPHIFDETKWTVDRELLAILFFISVIGLGNQVYSCWRFYASPSLGGFIFWQLITWGVGIFPVLGGVFLKQMRLMRQYESEARSLDVAVGSHQEQHNESPLVLQGDNQGELIRTTVQHLLLLEASDNYVQVYWLENDEVKSRLLRSTLKKMEEALREFPVFFRCHRTHIVNLDKVLHVSGNAQGFKLHLGGLPDRPVPVSRSLNGEIQRLLRV